MNWGQGIALFILAFVIFMGTMVYMSVNEDFYLVTENYYTEGINYDKVQVKLENVKELKNKINISQQSNEIKVIMPNEIKGGKVHFFRPSNGTLDFKVEFVDREFYVDKSKILKGKWILKFDWTDGDKEFYIEESISIL